MNKSVFEPTGLELKLDLAASLLDLASAIVTMAILFEPCFLAAILWRHLFFAVVVFLFLVKLTIKSGQQRVSSSSSSLALSSNKEKD